jgi:hypothetical protein
MGHEYLSSEDGASIHIPDTVGHTREMHLCMSPLRPSTDERHLTKHVRLTVPLVVVMDPFIRDAVAF